MAATPQFAATPVVGVANLTAVSACTTRAPVATANLATSNLFALTNTATTYSAGSPGVRIDTIQVVAASTAIGAATVAGLVGIWIWDGTNANLIAEIAVAAQTPSATAAAFTAIYTPTNPIVLPATHRLYASSTVATTAATNALQVVASGGAY